MQPFRPARICCFRTKLHASTSAKPREAFGSTRSRSRALSAQRPPLHSLAEHDLPHRPAADSLTAAHQLGPAHRTATTVPETTGDCAQCLVAPARLRLVDHLLLAPDVARRTGSRNSTSATSPRRRCSSAVRSADSRPSQRRVATKIAILLAKSLCMPSHADNSAESRLGQFDVRQYTANASF